MADTEKTAATRPPSWPPWTRRSGVRWPRSCARWPRISPACPTVETPPTRCGCWPTCSIRVDGCGRRDCTAWPRELRLSGTAVANHTSGHHLVRLPPRFAYPVWSRGRCWLRCRWSTTTVTSEKPRRPRGVSGTARVEAAEQRWEQRQFRASRSELEVPERLVRLRAQLDEATLLLDRCARVDL